LKDPSIKTRDTSCNPEGIGTIRKGDVGTGDRSAFDIEGGGVCDGTCDVVCGRRGGESGEIDVAEIGESGGLVAKRKRGARIHKESCENGGIPNKPTLNLWRGDADTGQGVGGCAKSSIDSKTIRLI